jgi:YjbE family integral membrane protein
MRIILTIFAVALLTLPWLKLAGSLLLFWIGIKLLIPEDDDENVSASDNLIAAIKTILIADLVMSIDNVIAVAAAAQGSYTLLILGLAISIPLVIFGSTLLLHLMERWPVIITIGGGLLGFVGPQMSSSAVSGLGLLACAVLLPMSLMPSSIISHCTPGWLRTSRSSRASALTPAKLAPSVSTRFPPMPWLTIAMWAVALSAASRVARIAGHVLCVSGVEREPSVMESPKATMSGVPAGASTSTAASQ